MGRAAVAEMPEDSFGDLITEQIAAGETRWVANLCWLRRAARGRLKAVVEYGRNHLGPAELAKFWNGLTAAESVSAGCVELSEEAALQAEQRGRTG